MNASEKIRVDQVVFRKDLYPRIEHNQAKVQEYSENLENLPPIEVNQHFELIDGFHRWTAHKLKECEFILASITKTTSDDHLLELAIRMNAQHGLQLSQKDKRSMAVLLYSRGTRGAERKKELGKLLSVTPRAVSEWVSDLDQAEREQRREKIKELHFRAHTTEEIGQAVGLSSRMVENEVTAILEDVPKFRQVQFSDGFNPPLFNVWSFGKKTNETEHFGNTEQRILDNLLYLYTEPNDIVVDPFGGGASTLDVCVKRGRRCWISDRKPKAGLEEKIRALDICENLPPLHNRWKDVSLVYLDPPYWKQAENQYSQDSQDLANMPLEEFTEKLSGVVRSFLEKVDSGKIVSLIIQPTQWRSDPKGKFEDHIYHLISAVGSGRALVENRVSCPYSTEQYTPQMVNWAKESKKLLVLTRELIVWRKL